LMLNLFHQNFQFILSDYAGLKVKTQIT